MPTLRSCALLPAALVAATGILACGEKGHEHGPGGAHAPHGEVAELPGQSVTLWATRTELFMEYRPLIVGQPSSFAAHVTEMPSFKAVTSGAATLTLTYADGAKIVAKADSPSNPGIFRPIITPDRAGPCQLGMAIEGAQLTETFAVGSCVVFADEAAARAALGEEEETPGRIVYLKEQQWKTDFATVAVTEHDLQDGVRASGEIRPVAGREAQISAPSGGRLSLAEPVPLIGMPVKEGQLVATIAPRLVPGGDRATLAADVIAAAAEVDAAKVELTRSERLVADQAAPTRTVEEARTRLRIAEARLGGVRGRLAQYDAGSGGRRFQVRAPISGTLVALGVASGENVEEGQLLLRIIDLDQVWLVTNVFEPDIPRVEGARSAWFTIEGYKDAFTVDETNGKLVTVGRVIDPRTRTTPVIFEVENRAGRFRIGNFTKVVIATGAPRKGLAIPESAIVEDGGKSIAYVMVEGEAFERRPLRLGVRSNGWVEVLEGVAAGEHVVSTGSYEIKLASASGSVPAHGHAH